MAKKNTQQEEVRVAIRLSSSRQRYVAGNRYINWIDEHWYESVPFPNFDILASDIEKVKGWLKDHFINYAEFIYPNGESEVWSAFGDKFGEITFTL